jgi:8-oxo-dGTP pyrophosphatase MutT (NUDIX family)
MPNPTIGLIRSSLGALAGEPLDVKPPAGSAAVALILSGHDKELSLCFIRRADREGDPWSGHMAFPGGRADISDSTPLAVAERETLEEVGIQLDARAFIGALPRMPVRRGGTDTGMALSSFVYYIGPDQLPFLPNHEVANAYWIPFSHLWDGSNFTTLSVVSSGVPLSYRAIRYQGNLIWGLSYRVLELFAEVVGCRLPQI